MRQRCALLATRAIQRVMSGAHHAFEIIDHARIDLIGRGWSRIRRHFAVLRRERGNLAGGQCADPGALHAQRGGAERFPSVALFLDESLGRYAHATGGTSLGPRREAAAALALLLREYRGQIGVRVLLAARDPAFETP